MRLTEIIVLLACYNKKFIPGLTIGCLLANLASPMGLYDICFGTAATLIACLGMYYVKNVFAGALIGGVVNGLIVGLELYLALELPFMINACLLYTSKLFLILVTCWLLRHLKFTFPVPNKQYSLVIITEVVILSIFGMISYDNVEVTASYSPVIICILLLITFILIIINGIYLNRIYAEKMQYEKQLQKEKYIKQSLRLIQNISYDIDDKKHRIHWILEHIKHLNNDTNPEISKAIERCV